MMKFLVLPISLVLASPTLAASGDPDDDASKPAVRSAPPADTSRSGRGIMRYDANGDGVVDRDEWVAGQSARFQGLDRDGDGKLSQEEMFARTPAAASVLPTDRQVQRQSTYFRRLDTDKDGSVTLAEFLTGSERNFARCDANKDGRTDTAECRVALQRNR
ncbi:MAG: EF-hand domain-containing protein [Pseudomonadota bacterium]